jgi:hypothetical protein
MYLTTNGDIFYRSMMREGSDAALPYFMKDGFHGFGYFRVYNGQAGCPAVGFHEEDNRVIMHHE